MAEDQDDAQKTEDATPRKLEQAREKGQLPMSQEVKHWFALFSALLVVGLYSPTGARRMAETFAGFFGNLHLYPMDSGGIGRLGLGIISEVGLILLIPIGILMIVGLAGGILQTGFLFTTEPIIPKLSKISPLAGLKRLFSMKSLVETGKSVFKIALIGALAVMILMPDLNGIDALTGLDPLSLLDRYWWLAVKVIGAALAIMTVIAGIDYAFQLMEFMKQQRMTMQEVKDEYKQSEGDPMVKGRIRQIRMERARNRMMSAVPDADVIVTNPTHFAVALKYDPDEMNAPICLAKAQDHMALKMREIAKEHDIIIVENPPLARALYPMVEPDREIPEEHFKAVAEVISYVFRLQRRHLN